MNNTLNFVPGAKVKSLKNLEAGKYPFSSYYSDCLVPIVKIWFL